jgi:hypothetical protein
VVDVWTQMPEFLEKSRLPPFGANQTKIRPIAVRVQVSVREYLERTTSLALRPWRCTDSHAPVRGLVKTIWS